MELFDTLKRKLRNEISNDLGQVIVAVKNVLNDNTATYNTLLLIEGRYNQLLAVQKKGIIQYPEQTTTTNTIRSNLQELIEEIKIEDVSIYIQQKTSDQQQTAGVDLDHFIFYNNLKNPSLRIMEANFRKPENRDLFNDRNSPIAGTDCFVAEYCTYRATRLRALQEEVGSLLNELEDFDIRSYAFYKRFLNIHATLKRELHKRAFLIIIESQHELSDLIDVSYRSLKTRADEVKESLNTIMLSGENTSENDVEDKLKDLEILIKRLLDYLSELANAANKEFYPKN